MAKSLSAREFKRFARLEKFETVQPSGEMDA